MGKSASPSPVSTGHPNGPVTPGATSATPSPVGTHAGGATYLACAAANDADDRHAAEPGRRQTRPGGSGSAAATPPGVGTVTSTAFRFFSPTSIWNTPLLPTAPIDPNSAAITGTLDELRQREPGQPHGALDQHDLVQHADLHGPREPANGTGDHQLRTTPSLRAAMAAVPVPAECAAGGWDRRGDDDLPAVDRHSVGDVEDAPVASFRLRPSRPPSVRADLCPRARTTTRVTALTPTGETTISPVHAYSVPAGGKVTLRWSGPVGATGYRIYRGPDASHLQLVATCRSRRRRSRRIRAASGRTTGSSAPSSVSPPTTNTATTPGQWHASWGGRIQHVSLDPGYYRNIPNGAGGYSSRRAGA